jgi:ubiquinol-cytochrome c reductase cytochrome c subunit
MSFPKGVEEAVMPRFIRFAAAVCTVACVSFGATAERTTTAQIAHGRRLYVATGCQQCHGLIGQGTVGPRLAPGPIPLDIFTRQLRHPRGVMPVYTAVVMSNSDVADIYSYLNSIPQPAPVAAIPLLR